MRVFDAIKRRQIGDVIIDPFGTFRRGKVRLAERDMWVTVSPLVPTPGEEISPNKVNEISRGAPEATR